MTGPPHPPDGYLFLVTYGRSGSTLVQHLLNRIDGVTLRGENNNALWHIFNAWHALDSAAPIRDLRARGGTTGPAQPWFGAEAIDADALGHAMVHAFVTTVLRPPPGTRVAGFKEIRMHADPSLFAPYLDFIRRFFPGSRFVFNTRDHAAVARSAWWAICDPAYVRATLAEAEALFAAYARANPDCCAALHYDDYMRDPAALQPLFDLLGQRPPDNVIAEVLAQQLDHGRYPAFRK